MPGLLAVSMLLCTEGALQQAMLSSCHVKLQSSFILHCDSSVGCCSLVVLIVVVVVVIVVVVTHCAES